MGLLDWYTVAIGPLAMVLLGAHGAHGGAAAIHLTLSPESSLTVQAVASSHGSLVMALLSWPIAFVLAATYFIFISRKYAGKVSVRRDN